MKRVIYVVICWSLIFINVYSQQDKPDIPKGTINKIPVVNNRIIQEQFLIPIYEKDFNSGLSGWITNGNWRMLTTSTSLLKISNNSLNNVVDGKYSNNVDETIVSPTIRIPKLNNGEKIYLNITEAFEIELGYDKGYVKVSKDNGTTWSIIGARDGYSELRVDQINISRFAGNNIKLMFEFISDDSFNFKGWFIQKISISKYVSPQALGATITSLNSQNFPFIYMNMDVDDNGIGINNLTKSNFSIYENNSIQTDLFSVTPPNDGGGVRLADIVFLMDNSGSMGGEQTAIRENVINFVDGLVSTGIDFNLGLCRYGADDNYGNPIIEDNGILTDDPLYFKDSVWSRNTVDGGTEPGYYAITESARNFSFRPGARKIFIIITDETPNQGGSSENDALNSLTSNSITLFALTENDLSDTFSKLTSSSNGNIFDIYSSFDQILNYIKTQVSNSYVLSYRSSNPNFDGVTRNVEIRVKYNGEEANDYAQYTPGASPVITRTTKTTDYHKQAWADGTSFDIEVEVVDNISPGVQSVTLFYKNTSDVSYTSISMTSISGNIYSGTIPASDVTTPGVDYYITATDGISTSSAPSTNPSTNPFQIAILPNVAPAITHTPVTSLSIGNDISIDATVIDITNSLVEVKLFYRKLGQLLYKEQVMISNYGDSYSGTIPGSEVTSDGIEYYIFAYDNFGVGNYSGSADYPHKIESTENYESYLAEKSNLIYDILSIEPLTNYLGFRTKPYFYDVESQASEFVNNVQIDNQIGIAAPLDLEGIARLTLTERVTHQALIDAIDISEYGAKGFSSIAFAKILSFTVKHIGVLIKNLKIPLISNGIYNTLNSAHLKLENSINKLQLSFFSGAFPQANLNVDYDLTRRLSEEALTTAYNKIGKSTINLIDEGDFNTSIFETADRTIQEYLFILPFELLSITSQDAALKNTLEHNFISEDFNIAKSDATNVYLEMKEFSKTTLDYSNFVATVKMIADIAILVGSVVLVVVGIIAALPSGGSSLLASIAGIATILLKIGSIFATSSAIVEAGVSLYAVNYQLPFSFIKPSAQVAFGKNNNSVLDKTFQNYITVNNGNTESKFDYSVKSNEYFNKLQKMISTGDSNWAKLVDDSLSYYDNLIEREDEISISEFLSVKEYAKSKVPAIGPMIQNYISLSAAQNLYSAGLEISAFVYQSGIQNNSIINDASEVVDSIQTNYNKLKIVRSNTYKLLYDNSIHIPTTIGIGVIDFEVISKDPPRLYLKIEIKNYGDTKADGILVSPYIASESVIIIGENTKRVNLNANSSQNIEFLIGGDINSILTGAVAIEPSSSNDNYVTLSNKSFLFDFSMISPDVPGNLSNENIYAYPNPYNPNTDGNLILRFKLKIDGSVTISIYDVTGSKIKELLSSKSMRGGIQLSVEWDGKDEKGNIVSNGVYFYVIESSAGERAVGKIAILK